MTCLLIHNHRLHANGGSTGVHDLIDGITEKLGLGSLRNDLYRNATGKVLEVAVGTGLNLRHYPKGCEIIGVDLSRSMLEVAEMRAQRLSTDITLQLMDAELLAFEDECFDTVTSSLSLCSFTNPLLALREMSRVCKPHGRILLLEHGRSDRPWIGHWQDRRANAHLTRGSCQPNRDPLDLIHRAGLKIVQVRTRFFGMIHTIEAMPATRPDC
jgi:SAM-dependent methyltransferase